MVGVLRGDPRFGRTVEEYEKLWKVIIAHASCPPVSPHAHLPSPSPHLIPPSRTLGSYLHSQW